MMPSVQARFLANVIGNPAVVVTSLITFVFVTYSPLEFWLKVMAFLILSPTIIGGGFRLFRGGEQGTTDLEITPDRLLMTNIPLPSTRTILTQSLDIYQRQTQPLPKPAGVVTGNPAETQGVIELESAGLPDSTEVDGKTLEVPPDAIAVANTAVSGS